MVYKCIENNCIRKAMYNEWGKSAIYCSDHCVKGMYNVTLRYCDVLNCRITAIFGFKDKKERYCFEHSTKDMINIKAKICEDLSCGIQAMYGLVNGKPQFCYEHAKGKNMVDLRNKLCDECPKRATFGFPNNKKTKCADHKTIEMIDVANKRCSFKGCTSINPSFGIKGQKPCRCEEHKTSEMISLKKKNECIVEKCDTTSSYGLEGGKPTHCAIHGKLIQNMVNLMAVGCAQKDCPVKHPTYNVKGEKKGKYCKEHKTSDMIDVDNPTCGYVGCPKQPCYGIKGNKVKYCVEHKDNTMMNIVSKRCKQTDCTVANPCFDVIGGKGTYCGEHAPEGMIDVKKKMCQDPDCDKKPLYNIKGSKKGLFCIEHKSPEMVDVEHRQCVTKDCIGRPTYGKIGFPATHCFKCKSIEHTKNPNKQCSECRKSATYGINKKLIHCETHKQPTEINLAEQKCKSCGLMMLLDSSNLCEYCNPTVIKTARLAKQNALMDYLDSRGLTGVSTDKTINHAECGKERPDRIYETPSFILILECDENQHRERQCDCEQQRMINIGQSFGGLPTHFIRWNPDDYKPKHKNIQQESLTNRHKLVGDLIESILNNNTQLSTDSFVSAFYMYYDNWSTLNDEQWVQLMAIHKSKPTKVKVIDHSKPKPEIHIALPEEIKIRIKRVKEPKQKVY